MKEAKRAKQAAQKLIRRAFQASPLKRRINLKKKFNEALNQCHGSKNVEDCEQSHRKILNETLTTLYQKCTSVEHLYKQFRSVQAAFEAYKTSCKTLCKYASAWAKEDPGNNEAKKHAEACRAKAQINKTIDKYLQLLKQVLSVCKEQEVGKIDGCAIQIKRLKNLARENQFFVDLANKVESAIKDLKRKEEDKRRKAEEAKRKAEERRKAEMTNPQETQKPAQTSSTKTQKQTSALETAKKKKKKKTKTPTLQYQAPISRNEQKRRAKEKARKKAKARKAKDKANQEALKANKQVQQAQQLKAQKVKQLEKEISKSKAKIEEHNKRISILRKKRPTWYKDQVHQLQKQIQKRRQKIIDKEAELKILKLPEI